MNEVSVEKTYSENNLSWLRIIKILLAVVVGVVILFVIFLPEPNSRETQERAERIKCMANMRNLGIALYIYAQDNSNSYPTPDKWCDLLVNKFGDFNYQYFRCPGGKGDMCSYAINPNCDPNSPEDEDLVLLFETKGGWNRFGGPEILTTENHGWRRCNVLFNDGHVEFVKTEQLGQLKWGVEKEQNDKSKFKNE